MRIEMWNGIYWDHHGIQRECVIVCFKNGKRIAAIDKLTREPIPDPPSAIPVSPVEDRSKP